MSEEINAALETAKRVAADAVRESKEGRDIPWPSKSTLETDGEGSPNGDPRFPASTPLDPDSAHGRRRLRIRELRF